MSQTHLYKWLWCKPLVEVGLLCRCNLRLAKLHYYKGQKCFPCNPALNLLQKQIAR